MSEDRLYYRFLKNEVSAETVLKGPDGSYQLSAISYQLSAISYQLSASWAEQGAMSSAGEFRIQTSEFRILNSGVRSQEGVEA